MTKDANASFSRLELYSNCPRQYQYKYIDKLQEEPRPQQLDRHGNAKLAAHERGSILHEAADDFINSRIDTLHKELKNLAPELRAAREIKSTNPERISTEQKMVFKRHVDTLYTTKRRRGIPSNHYRGFTNL